MLASRHVKSAYLTPLPIHSGTNSGRTSEPSAVVSRNRKLYFDGVRFSAWNVNVWAPASKLLLASSGALSRRMSLRSSATWPAPVYLTTTVYDAASVSVHSWKLSPTGVSSSQVLGVTGQASSPGVHGSV